MRPVLASHESCTGCTACASICPKGCIEMKPDRMGFLHPEINRDECMNCLQCQQACPIISPHTLPEQETLAYAGKSIDDDIRSSSSSGGIFSELVHLVFKRGGVVWGAEYDGTFSVRHASAETEEQAKTFRGAKYAQSDLSGVFQRVKDQLANGTLVLFSGLPCQVGGLLGFLGEHYSNLICVDFVCHSVPSPLIWSRYLQYRSQKDGDGEQPITVNLRSKETGWSRYRYSVQIQFPQGLYSAVSGSDPFMRLFTGGCISRDACNECHFKGVDRQSDITLGDCWGIWDFDPEFDDDRGISLILVHSSLGNELLRELAERCRITQIGMEAGIERNPAIIQPCRPHQKKTAVLNLLMKSNNYDSAVDLVQQKSLVEKVKRITQRFLG